MRGRRNRALLALLLSNLIDTSAAVLAAPAPTDPTLVQISDGISPRDTCTAAL